MLLLSVRKVWGHLFSSDPAIIDLVAVVLPLAAVFQLFDGIGAVGGGALRGCGRQKLGAVANLTGYYVLGLPLGALFTFHFGMKLLGLWLGLTVGLVTVSAIEFYIIFFTMDWQIEALNALRLVRTHSYVASTDEGYGSLGQREHV